MSTDTKGFSKVLPSSLVWVGKLDCPDTDIDATAVLVSEDNSAPKPSLPLGVGGRLRLLTAVLLDTVPLILFTPTVFNMFINSTQIAYINGLVNRLLPPMQTALLVKIEGAADQSLADDPFASNLEPSLATIINPWALVYVEPSTSSRLVMHILDKSSSKIGCLVNASANMSAAVENTSLEHEFITQLAKLDQQVQSSCLPSALTANIDTPKPQPPPINNSSSPADDDIAQSNEQIEKANKQLAKQLIIASLKSRRIGRDHKDFAALWGQIYRSLKFAMRDKLSCKLTVKNLRAQVEKHTDFYLG
ncbi:hypothetical protein IWW36_002774 [Coemansia brasiliensis]|uniref:Sld7 C-terminal domain-containing protein n=1 Tax=Coemansia brasiliensis TaxID=2650707 RepID=A0A9W8I6G3_9FUNG|nr:hypothetical protein IWW36_002774 [Coemansia brasiliensis]